MLGRAANAAGAADSPSVSVRFLGPSLGGVLRVILLTKGVHHGIDHFQSHIPL